MNKAVLIGRLTREPEVRRSKGESGMAMAHFILAVDRRYRRDGEQSADFINCAAFGKSAEVAEKCLRKGSKIAISGRIQTGSYANKDGQKFYTTDVIVEEWEFAESKKESGENASRRITAQTDSDGFMSAPNGINEELPLL